MIQNVENKYKGWLNVDSVSVNKKGKIVNYEVVNKKSAVAAVVYDTVKEKYIFVKQWRVGSTSDLIEVVAGTLDKNNEDPREAIKREILEEIGYETDYIKLLDEFYTSPGGTNEMVTIYYCEVSNKVAEGGGLEEESEEIEIVEMSREEVLTTRFLDAKTIIGVSFIKEKSVK
ncbi:NUDIX hydrolase [bacterium]|nr:NUDIX hydrolase [bacterium]